MKWRPGPDGTLFIPRRGSPIDCPDGYKLMGNDPYRAVPILPNCEQRKIIKLPTICCGGRDHYKYCDYYSKAITNLHCLRCEYVKTIS